MMEDRELTPRERALVQEAVRDALFQIGIDVSEHEGVLEARRNFEYLSKLRRGSESLTAKGLASLVVTLLGGTLMFLGLGIKNWLETIGGR